jgi:hypothetical protein
MRVLSDLFHQQSNATSPCHVISHQGKRVALCEARTSQNSRVLNNGRVDTAKLWRWQKVGVAVAKWSVAVRPVVQALSAAAAHRCVCSAASCLD